VPRTIGHVVVGRTLARPAPSVAGGSPEGCDPRVGDVRVLEIWRYPVKSMQGERVDGVHVQSQGLSGDRGYALFDIETGFGLTARRQPELLFAFAAAQPDGTVLITLPDGSVAADDNALSEWLGHPVTLRAAAQPGRRVYENPADFEGDAGWEPFRGATGAFHDSERANVAVVSTATMRDWPWRRFRPNVIVDGAEEDSLVASRINLGGVTLDVDMRIKRCVMVTRPQPDGIDKDLDVLRTIHRERDGYLAIGCSVVAPGVISVGEELVRCPST